MPVSTQLSTTPLLDDHRLSCLIIWSASEFLGPREAPHRYYERLAIFFFERRNLATLGGSFFLCRFLKTDDNHMVDMCGEKTNAAAAAASHTHTAEENI